MSVVRLVVENKSVDFEIKEYNGVRVVSFRDVDTLHEKTSGAARKAFNSHRNQFAEGEDYFVLNTDEAFKLYGVKAPNGLMMFSESGYLLIVKPFNDDLAWKVQKQLINNYFKAKEMIINVKQPTAPQTIEDILISALTSMKEMKEQNAELKRAVNHLEVVVDNEIILTRSQRSEIQQAVDRRQGELFNEGYTSAHFQGIYKTLKTHFNVPSYSEIKRTDFPKAISIIQGWFPKKKENTPSL